MKKWVILPAISVLAVLSLGFRGTEDQTETKAVSSLLEQTSHAFTQIAEKAMPATVYIKAEFRQQAQEANPLDLFQEDFFRRFFGGNPFQTPQQPQNQPQIAGGSGFLITSDGFVVTNNHVIKDASSITVTLNDGREYSASIRGTDPRTDLALLKIEETELPFLTFGDSDSLKIGELAVAIGNPFGIGATLTTGVISAKGRQDLGIASYEDFIQTDAAINPGNSGGPLLNIHGEVIGVNTAIYTRSGGYMGIGLSIPSRMAQNVIEQIFDSGAVKRGYLGIILQPVDKDLAEALNLDNQEGALVSDVVKGSAASKAGLQPGDIILESNHKPVKSVSKLRNEIGMMNPSTQINLLVLRDGEKVSIDATLGSLEGETLSAELLQKLGLELENLNPELAAKLGYSNTTEGIVITKVKAGSPAAQAGLRSGFLITGVAINWNQQKSVNTITALEEALKDIGDKKHLILIVRHQNFQRYYTVKLG